MLGIVLPANRIFGERVANRMSEFWMLTKSGIGSLVVVDGDLVSITNLSESGPSSRISTYHVRYGTFENRASEVRHSEVQTVIEEFARIGDFEGLQSRAILIQPESCLTIKRFSINRMDSVFNGKDWLMIEQILRLVFTTNLDGDKFLQELLSAWALPAVNMKLVRGHSGHTFIVKEIGGQNAPFEEMLTLARRYALEIG